MSSTKHYGQQQNILTKISSRLLIAFYIYGQRETTQYWNTLLWIITQMEQAKDKDKESLSERKYHFNQSYGAVWNY